MISDGDKLILLCSRTDFDHESERQVSHLLKTGLDWPAAIARSLHFGVAPLLSHNLKQIGPPLIPEYAVAELRHIYYQNAARNHLLSQELVAVIRLLRDQGIASIPLKGIGLAQDVYGHIGLRMLSDLDLLVRESDLIPATRLLVQDGYELSGPHPEEYDLSHFSYAVELEKSGSVPCLLELHRSLNDGYYHLPESLIWENQAEQTLNGAVVLALSPELMLVYLVLHLHHHGFSFKVLVDVSETVRAYGERLKWDKVATWIRAYDLTGSFEVAIKSCQRMFGRAVPACLLDGDGQGSVRRRWLVSLVANEDWYFQRGENLQRNPYLGRLFGLLFLNVSLVRILIASLQSAFLPAIESVAAKHHLPRRSIRLYWHLVRRPVALIRRLTIEALRMVFAIRLPK